MATRQGGAQAQAVGVLSLQVTGFKSHKSPP